MQDSSFLPLLRKVFQYNVIEMAHKSFEISDSKTIRVSQMTIILAIAAIIAFLVGWFLFSFIGAVVITFLVLMMMGVITVNVTKKSRNKK